ncbi:MAG: fused MFS/spermidine synthase [Candidatus Hydrogenedentes bacterium]|nr:fused MFS/spermidine synthase [Candidatus Hydrogenedentota bacterium]
MNNASTPQSNVRSRAGAVALSCIVFVSGGAVMVYEFIAVRILQRFYGSSLDVWAAEISVCLAGLAIGYSLGGFFADRYRSWTPLGAMLAMAGLSAVFMEALVKVAVDIVPQQEMVQWWEPLVGAGFSTFLPILALGTVMPQCIRLYVRDLEHVGSGAGRVAALSTVGSIVGVLLTVRVFLMWGVIESLYAISGLLVIMGVMIIGIGGVAKARARRVASLGILTLVTGLAHADVIYENYTAYHHILVKDNPDRRILYFDSDAQSAMSLKDPTAGGFEYTQFFHTVMLLDPSIENVLFVGLGGGTGPKSYLATYPNVKIDVAEIDPEVVKVAKKYFQVPDDPRLHIVTSDGRTYLQRSKKVYGAILMDAYGSGRNGAYIPPHLATQEFFKAAYDRLSNGGVLFYNVMGVPGGLNDDVVHGMLVTLESVFQMVYAFEAESSSNTVFVAQKIVATELDANGVRDGKAWPEGPWFAHPLDNTGFAQLVDNLRKAGRKVPADLEHRLSQVSSVLAKPRNGKLFTDNNATLDLAPGSR